MRALVVRGPRDAAVLDVPEPVAEPGLLVVDVERAGICGTDVEFYVGDMAYLDLGYAEFPLRLGHEWTEDRWAGFDRDLEAAVDGAVTIRLGWRQVVDPCRVALALARLLRRLGWQGEARPCRPGCSVGAARAS